MVHVLQTSVSHYVRMYMCLLYVYYIVLYYNRNSNSRQTSRSNKKFAVTNRSTFYIRRKKYAQCVPFFFIIYCHPHNIHLSLCIQTYVYISPAPCHIHTCVYHLKCTPSVIHDKQVNGKYINKK